MVLPADKEELKEFQDKCLSNTKMVVEITLPNACLFLPDKHFFEVLYNRYNTFSTRITKMNECILKLGFCLADVD